MNRDLLEFGIEFEKMERFNPETCIVLGKLMAWISNLRQFLATTVTKNFYCRELLPAVLNASFKK